MIDFMDITLDEISNIVEEKTKENQGIKRCEVIFQSISQGDSIICTDIQEISKNSKQLCELIEVLVKQKCRLVVGDMEIDCRGELTSETQGMIKMALLFNRLEHEILSQRVKLGIASAKANGKSVGRPTLSLENIPKEVIENYDLLEQGKLNKTDYAKRCNISRPTLNKYLEIMKVIR